MIHPIQIEKRQRNVLRKLIETAAHTDFGEQYHFSQIQSYQQFSKQLPVQSYGDISDAINKLKKRETNILWPGTADKFAVSSGTTGAGKHLPLTDDRLQSDKHFMRKVAWSYLKQRPNIFKLVGKHLSMPGSVEKKGTIQIGEITGFTARHAASSISLFQLVSPSKLATLPFQKKFNLLLSKALDADLRVITAAPSWALTFFQEALRKTGWSTIADIWPNLQLLVCGGVKLANYHSHLEKLAGGLSLDFIETYGASEGYFGFSDDLSKNDLKLITGNGIFYELQTCPQFEHSAQKLIPLWEAKKNQPYSLFVSTNAGLWRYEVGDIIEFSSLAPPKFKVKGRTNEQLDDFGEALRLTEARSVLNKTAKRMNIKTGNFAISPILNNEESLPYHQWFIQFVEPVSDDKVKRLATCMDQHIQRINRHYAIRRESGALGEPIIQPITQNDINRWLKNHDKAKAQGKLPNVLSSNQTKL